MQRYRVTRTLVYEGDEAWLRGVLDRRVTRLTGELSGPPAGPSYVARLIVETAISDMEPIPNDAEGGPQR